ncbi:creatininase family protein [Micromonospora sp. NPDC048999]|uniref:creatininase family protein n=1 Tax=Micromonospora sp. NPDC048999 TaxID=3155391 RepID=UPI00340F0CC4
MNRWYGSLSAPEIATQLTERSVLCLPIGSYEQHGPHLPLHTDTVVAAQTGVHQPPYQTLRQPTLPLGAPRACTCGVAGTPSRAYQG